MYYDVQKSAERIRDLRTYSNLPQIEAADKMEGLPADTASWGRRSREF